MTQKKAKLSLKQLTVTSFTTELTNAMDLRAGAEEQDQVQGTFVACTGGGWANFTNNCC